MGVPGGGHDGRQPGAIDKQPNPARIIPMAEKWNFAEQALSHAERMLNILVSLAEDITQPGGVRLMAADKFAPTVPSRLRLTGEQFKIWAIN